VLVVVVAIVEAQAGQQIGQQQAPGRYDSNNPPAPVVRDDHGRSLKHIELRFSNEAAVGRWPWLIYFRLSATASKV
jgi:hypothetical protein